jgi:hypothetical protein
LGDTTRRRETEAAVVALNNDILNLISGAVDVLADVLRSNAHSEDSNRSSTLEAKDKEIASLRERLAVYESGRFGSAPTGNLPGQRDGGRRRHRDHSTKATRGLWWKGWGCFSNVERVDEAVNVHELPDAPGVEGFVSARQFDDGSAKWRLEKSALDKEWMSLDKARETEAWLEKYTLDSAQHDLVEDCRERNVRHEARLRGKQGSRGQRQDRGGGEGARLARRPFDPFDSVESVTRLDRRRRRASNLSNGTRPEFEEFQITALTIRDNLSLEDDAALKAADEIRRFEEERSARILAEM